MSSYLKTKLQRKKSRHFGNWLPTSKNDAKIRKRAQNQRKTRAKICSEILVAIVFRIFSRYDIHIYIYICIYICVCVWVPACIVYMCRGIYCAKYYGQGGGMVPGKKMKNEAVRNKMKKKGKWGKEKEEEEKRESDFFC